MGLMPPHEDKLNDEEIAAIMTCVRNAWNNEDTPVAPSLVSEVRSETAVREQPWTDTRVGSRS